MFVWNSFGDPSSPVGKRESGTVEYHSESEGFWSKSHWCTWPGSGQTEQAQKLMNIAALSMA